MNIGKIGDIEYLKYGNEKQKKSYKILTDGGIMEGLQKYNPILAGTIPLGIDIENSDLDIICRADNFQEFKVHVTERFSKEKDFKVEVKEEFVICNFKVGNMEIEIYTSRVDSVKSNGVRHMVIEDRIMKLARADFKDEIISLKKAGIKTEPAFAEILGIKGCPYEGLLKLETCSDEEIRSMY